MNDTNNSAKTDFGEIPGIGDYVSPVGLEGFGDTEPSLEAPLDIDTSVQYYTGGASREAFLAAGINTVDIHRNPH